MLKKSTVSLGGSVRWIGLLGTAFASAQLTLSSQTLLPVNITGNILVVSIAITTLSYVSLSGSKSNRHTRRNIGIHKITRHIHNNHN
ncbi:MAG: hypothetical protein HYY22_00330 [Thaumarchaeota archaeon]|nr:hypothetical protein [Nitrososphaerota archaeon]